MCSAYRYRWAGLYCKTVCEWVLLSRSDFIISIEDKLYVNWLSGISADEYRYYTEQIDVSTDKVVIQCNMNESIQK